MKTIGDYSVIADVGLTLVKLLRDNMTPEPITHPELIGLASPADKGDLYLSLFLYNVKESGDSRKTQMIGRGQGTVQYPPMAIDLSYLLTAHSPADIASRAVDEQRILGRAMQVIFDHSIIKNSMLQGTLYDNDEEIRVVMESLPADLLISMWNFSDVPYKHSVSYTVGPIYLDSTRVKTVRRVTERDINING